MTSDERILWRKCGNGRESEFLIVDFGVKTWARKCVEEFCADHQSSEVFERR